MCISYPGRVVAVDGPNAVVDTIGRRRRASTLVVPDVTVGEWVLVGAGSVLRRLDPDDALALTRALDTARAATPPSAHRTATPEGDRP
jgi:hydrogenase assembly chaperone HypC/HupF